MSLMALFPRVRRAAETTDGSSIEAPPGFEALPAVSAEDRPGRADRPWVLTNMVASADGATAIDGLSGPLGGPADYDVFVALRSVSDMILVGAATVREEDYRSPGPGSTEVQAARAERGQSPLPRLVIVTAGLSLDPDQRVFGDPDNPPLIATVANAPSDRRTRLAEVADIIDCGNERVDLARLVRLLGQHGAKTILSEGGPSLNGQLIADDLIDEWNLTLSPILASGSSARPAHGPTPANPPPSMRLDRVWQADELLFCRWVRPTISLDRA